MTTSVVRTNPLRRVLPTAAALMLGLSAAVAAHAQAQGPGLYVGASLGKPDYDRIAGIDGGGDSVAGKIYGGYSLLPNLAVEAGITGLGRVDGPFGGRVKGYGGFVDAVGSLPLTNQWSLLGRLGVGHVRMEAPVGKDGDTMLKVGLGAQYALSNNVALRGEWERYRAGVFGAKPNIDQYTLGVTYRF